MMRPWSGTWIGSVKRGCRNDLTESCVAVFENFVTREPLMYSMTGLGGPRLDEKTHNNCFEVALMRIAVVGAGGVGGYFGARLAQSGEDVVFVARGPHLRTMQKTGLRVDSPTGDFHLQDILATDDPEKFGPVDYILVAVKAWQLGDALRTAAPLVGTDTAIIPLLNGVEAAETIARAFGSEHALGGLCGIFSHLEAPGHVNHLGGGTFIKFGERNNSASPRVERLREALVRSGIDAEITPDIDVAIWQKFLFIAPASSIGAVTRATYRVMVEMPEVNELLLEVVDEVFRVGQAKGIELEEAHKEASLDLLRAAPKKGTTSMQRDIENGRPSELEAQTGAVVRLGKCHGVATPVCDVLYRCLLPQERRARGETAF